MYHFLFALFEHFYNLIVLCPGLWFKFLYWYNMTIAGFRLAWLAALPLNGMIITSNFRVTALCSHAALALSPKGITPEFNRIQLSAVCHCEQSGGVINLLAWRFLPHGLPYCSKWHLRSSTCSNITIKVPMCQAAS